jgi:hypothetical protein
MQIDEAPEGFSRDNPRDAFAVEGAPRSRGCLAVQLRDNITGLDQEAKPEKMPPVHSLKYASTVASSLQTAPAVLAFIY